VIRGRRYRPNSFAKRESYWAANSEKCALKMRERAEVPRGTYVAGEVVVAEEADESTLPRTSGMYSAI
jgi:hypothetical protein